jgi:hypothetical protein
MPKGGARAGAGRPFSDFGRAVRKLTIESMKDIRTRQAFLRRVPETIETVEAWESEMQKLLPKLN